MSEKKKELQQKGEKGSLEEHGNEIASFFLDINFLMIMDLELYCHLVNNSVYVLA